MESPNGYTRISGSEHTPLPGAYVIGRPHPSRVIGVTVVVKPRSAGERLASADEMAARLPHERQ
jgi:hypothetical protein